MGNPIAAQITPGHLAHYRAQRTSKRLGAQFGVANISIRSSNKDMICIKAMFNKLIEVGEWSAANPIIGMKLPKASATELTFLRRQQILKVI